MLEPSLLASSRVGGKGSTDPKRNIEGGGAKQATPAYSIKETLLFYILAGVFTPAVTYVKRAERWCTGARLGGKYPHTTTTTNNNKQQSSVRFTPSRPPPVLFWLAWATNISDRLGPDGEGVGARGGDAAEREAVRPPRARLREALQLLQGQDEVHRELHVLSRHM